MTGDWEGRWEGTKGEMAEKVDEAGDWMPWRACWAGWLSSDETEVGEWA